MQFTPFEPRRRRLLGALLAAPFALLAGSVLFARDEAHAAPTPECDDGDEPTPSATAGPFFKPKSPERISLLESGTPGTRLEITGQVVGTDCKPIAGALLDFWQAGDDGEYDNEGFKLRGHQFADREGRFALTTVVPGVYPGRTRHIHVRVQPKGGRILTTQLYFPDEPGNRRDRLFTPELTLALETQGKVQRGRFRFVLGTA